MIWLILFFGLLLRIISLNQSLWLDEAINVLAVQNYSFFDLITKYAVADFHPPLFFMVSWIWGQIGGYSEIWMRIPSVFFGELSILSVYLIGRRLHSKNAGLLSAFILAVNPLHIYYSQEVRMYTLATLAVTLNMLLFIKLIEGNYVNWRGRGVYLLSNLVLLMSDYVALLILPVQFLFLVTTRKTSELRSWLSYLLISLVLTSWWLPMFIKQLSVGSVTSANVPVWKMVVGGFDIKAIPLTVVKFIIGRISLSDKFLYYLLLLPVCLIFLYVLFKGVRFIKGQYRNLLIFWVTIPVILATVVSFLVPIYSYFRLLFVLPAAIILVSFGIISSKGKIKYLLLTIILAVQLFSVSVYLFNHSYQREDWRGLVDYLRSVDRASLILFESSSTLPPFDYYAKGELNAKGALKDFPIKDSSQVIDLPTENQPKDIFLVNYLVEVGDKERLVAKKMVSLGYKESEVKDFTGVGFVYHYIKQ